VPVVALVLVAALAVVAAISSAKPASSVRSSATESRAIDHPSATLSAARLAQAPISWIGGPTTAKTGESVNVYVSAALAAGLGTPQTWADFLSGLLHGTELSFLTAYIGTLDDVREICGERALGCYGGNRMVSMGETMFGISAAEVVRHEYGHHIAFHRVNSPWQAIDWGPKNWASTEDVCRRAEELTAYPGDEGDHYSVNPGEAWAETYRLLEESRADATGSGWPIIDSSFYPDAVALQAAERDVLQPWNVGRRTVFRRTFSAGGKRVWPIALTTPLDGLLDVTVALPRNGLHEVALLTADRRTVLQTGLWASATTKRITTTICGERSLVLRVTQKGALGRVTVTATAP
jgi:hypothetical protein